MTTRELRSALARLLAIVAMLSLACGDPDSDVASDTEAWGPPQRIIAIAPSVTEMLFVLGLGDRVVGVGDYAEWPPEVHGKPKLGGLFNARLEAIAGLKPDLAVLLPSEERLRTDLEKMGVEVLEVRGETVADIEEMAMQIGARCRVERAAEAFVDRFREELRPVARQASIRVLLPVTRQPGRLTDLLVVGPDTFLTELLDRLGVENVMADATIAYPQVGLEEIILRSPQVVIELQSAPGDFEALRLDWLALGTEPGLADVCVRVVAGDHVLLPGPRLPRLYRELDEALMECVDRQ